MLGPGNLPGLPVHLKKAVTSAFFPLAVLSVVYLLFFLAVPRMTGDEVRYFYPASQNRHLLEYLAERWTDWSPRFLIEGLMVLVLRLPFVVWKVGTAAAAAITLWTVYFLFFTREKPVTVWVYCALFALCNFYQLSTSAGWVATTMNYLWPLAALVLCFVPVKLIAARRRAQKPVHQWWYALLVPAMLFAANMELYGGVLVFLSALLIANSLYRKEFAAYYYLLFAVSTAMVVVDLLCPGNAIRYQVTIGMFFPTFEALSLLQKTALGVQLCFYWLVSMNTAVFVVTAFLGAFIVFPRKTEPLAVRAASLFPGLAAAMVAAKVSFLNRFVLMDPYGGQFGGIAPGDTFHTPAQLFALAVIVLAFATYLALIFVVFKKTKQTAVLYVVVAAGFMSNLVLSYSPAAYASWIRTVTLLLVTLAILGTAFFGRLEKEHAADPPLVKLVAAVCVAAATASLAVQFHQIPIAA
jgi:hypothetical protein